MGRHDRLPGGRSRGDRQQPDRERHPPNRPREKKNWLFVGEAGAGQRGAILYSTIETCRRRKIDPYAYLRDVLTRLPSMTTGQIAAITPANWISPANRPSQIAA